MSTGWLLLVVITAQDVPAKHDDFWWLTTVLTVTTVYDVESTFHGLQKCGGCRESSPLGKLMVNRGRLPTYAIQFGLNLSLLLLARSKGGGWTSAVITIALGHFIAGTLNLRFVF